VERQEILGEPRHPSGQLDAGVPGAHDEKRKSGAATSRVGEHAGGLQAAQEMVTQVQRFGDGLEPDGVISETGDFEQPGDPARGQQQPVVAPAPPHQSAASLRCPAMRRVSRDRRTPPIG